MKPTLLLLTSAGVAAFGFGLAPHLFGSPEAIGLAGNVATASATATAAPLAAPLATVTLTALDSVAAKRDTSLQLTARWSVSVAPDSQRLTWGDQIRTLGTRKATKTTRQWSFWVAAPTSLRPLRDTTFNYWACLKAYQGRTLLGQHCRAFTSATVLPDLVVRLPAVAGHRGDTITTKERVRPCLYARLQDGRTVKANTSFNRPECPAP
jgi:hypothetical protein